MKTPICVYDMETDGINPHICQPVEVACVMIDQFTLDIIPDSQFESGMKPEGIDKDEYFTDDVLKTIDWHARLRKCSREDIINKWKNNPNQDVVWNLFAKHVDKYNKGGKQYTAPVAAGANIRNFDNIIRDRLNKKYGITRMFAHEVIDIRDLTFYSLVWDYSLPSRSMDKLREYFGMPESEAHTALADVIDEGMIISRFMKFHKSLFKKDKFRNSMKVENV